MSARRALALALLLLPAAHAARAETLAAALQALAVERDFVAEIAADMAGLPAKSPGGGEDALLALLRGTNHVLVRDRGRVVRVMVLGPAEPGDAPPRPALPPAVAGVEVSTAEVPVPDALAEERAAIARGLSPDTGEETGIAAALARASQIAARDRHRAWAPFGAQPSDR
ncbi:MAG TPA: hypothetical protein VED40_12335 [Azospirillaceae bacterium]|nr:hypothetical protein [Azospirillaceae bacterium]